MSFPSRQLRRATRYLLPAVLLVATSGCARQGFTTAPPPPPAPRNPGPVLTEVLPSPPVRTDLPPGPDPTPAPPSNAASAPDADRAEVIRDVAVLFNGSIREYADVAEELTPLLQPDRYRLTSIDIGEAGFQGAIRALGGQPELLVVAIGQSAARLARDELDTPVVFTQVFNYQELLVEGRPIRGVAPMPPLDLQLQEWKTIDPGLERLGLIVSERHAHLIAEAEEAAAGAAVSLTHRTSGSDQETLYMFRRMAGGIDGFWLVPDDRILSPAVLRELLDYAVSHGVRVTVFNDALLPWGALLSASITPADVAKTLSGVLERMIAGDVDDLPGVTHASQVGMRLNEQVAQRLGIRQPQQASWVVGRE